jgi:hypothetical protein
MSNEDPSEFENFVEDSIKYAAIREALDVTTNRFTLFLSERGVVFEPDEFTALSKVGDNQLDRVRLDAMAAANKMHVMQLAAAKLMSEYIQEQGKEPLADSKKHLQAQEVAIGSTPPWLQLIDLEFPGEPLNDDDDLDILIPETLQRNDIETDTAEKLDAARGQLLNYLESLGVTDLSEDEQYALAQLSTMYAMNDSRPSEQITASLRENAQLYVINFGLDMGVWGRVIDHFFGSESEE